MYVTEKRYVILVTIRLKRKAHPTSKIFDANQVYFDDSASLDNLLHFDSSAATAVRIKELETIRAQRYIAAEVATLFSKTKLTGTEDYSKFVDLMEFIPLKFRNSVLLQQFLNEAGLQTGSWISLINDLALLADKYEVGERYIDYLAGLIGLTFHATAATTLAEKRRQLIQAINWYKMRGTYQAYQYVGYALGLNLNYSDMYTKDYITFVRQPWYSGATGTNPTGLEVPGTTTSSTSLTIGLGSKTLTVGTGLSLTTSQNIALTYDASNYMLGTVTSYNSGTGQLVVNATSVTGSGTYTSWVVPTGYYKSPHFGMEVNLIQVYNSSVNTLLNWNFESWLSGINVAPTSWTLAGSGASVAREETIVKSNTYSAKLTRAGTDSSIYQDISSQKGATYWHGKTVTAGCWVWASAPNRARIRINDGVGNYGSNVHTGDSTWQFLSLTQVLSGSTTTVNLCCDVLNGNTSAYFDGAVLVEGTTVSSTGSYPGPDLWYLFDGTNTYAQIANYIEQIRPVNTVPHYSTLLTAQTDETGATTTLAGNVQTAVKGSWSLNQQYFDDGVTNFDNSPGKFFDYTATTFYNAIQNWQLGVGNKGVNPGLASFALQNPVVGLSGTVTSTTIYSDRVEYLIEVPTTAAQVGVSELGLYLVDGTTLKIGCTFPNITIIAGVQCRILVKIYF